MKVENKGGKNETNADIGATQPDDRGHTTRTQCPQSRGQPRGAARVEADAGDPVNAGGGRQICHKSHHVPGEQVFRDRCQQHEKQVLHWTIETEYVRIEDFGPLDEVGGFIQLMDVIREERRPHGGPHAEDNEKQNDEQAGGMEPGVVLRGRVHVGCLRNG
jgi:hypothetical protein